MERIEGQLQGQEKHAKQVVAWMPCTKRPLTTTELQHALAVENAETELDEENIPQVEDLVLICAGLVTVDEESNVIGFVHYTTQIYFEETHARWSPMAYPEMATICTTYLSLRAFANGCCRTD
jgi:hypothetical protein